MNHEKHERHERHEKKKPRMNTNKHELGKTTQHTENTEERRLTTRDELTEFLLYTAPDGQVKVECILHDETIWLTQDRIAELFGVQRPAITKHLKNIFASGELEEKVVSSILEHTTQHGAMEGKTQTRSVKFYNLDAIISVGYRVNSSNKYRILEGYGSVSRKRHARQAKVTSNKLSLQPEPHRGGMFVEIAGLSTA